MKKFTLKKNSQTLRCITAALALTTAMATSAQQVKTYDEITDDSGVKYSLYATNISANHRYISGQATSSTTGWTGIFVLDTETNAFAVNEGQTEMGGDLRGVSNDGVAVGYNPNALTLSIDGTMTELETPAGYESSAYDTSNDGKVVTGAYWSPNDYEPHACIWKDGKFITLPEPTTEEMGFNVRGTSANYCCGDASVIAGYIVDNHVTQPLIVWRLQDDGTYVCDPICKDYFGWYEIESTDKPYASFHAANISNNGKYAGVTIMTLEGESHMATIDLETREIREFKADGTGTMPIHTNTECMAVADDGTMVGDITTISGWQACIWRAGAAEPELLADKYPELTILKDFDSMGYHKLYDITPDGKYGIGIGYNAGYANASYVIEFEDTTTGIGKPGTTAGGNAETARYTIGGQRVDTPVKGLNIVKRADGSVGKVIVR